MTHSGSNPATSPMNPHPGAPATPPSDAITLANPGVPIPWQPEGDLASRYGGCGTRHCRGSLDHFGLSVTRNDDGRFFVVHDRGTAEKEAKKGEGGAANRNAHRAVRVPFGEPFLAGELLPDGEHMLVIEMNPTTNTLSVTIARGQFGKPTTWWRRLEGHTPATHPDPTKNHGNIVSSRAVLEHDRRQALEAKRAGDDTHWRAPSRLPQAPQPCMANDPVREEAPGVATPPSVGVHPAEGEGAPTDGTDDGN